MLASVLLTTPVPSWLRYLSILVGYLDEWGVVVPLILGVRLWARLSEPLRMVVCYYGFWLAQAPLNVYSRRVLHTNMYLHHLDTLVETWLLGWAYYRALNRSRLQPWIPVLLVAYTGVAVADATYWTGLLNLNIYSRVAQTVLMLCLLLWYLEHWLRRLPQQQLRYDGMFLVTVGLALYFTGSITGHLFGAMGYGEYIQRASGSIVGLVSLAGMVFITRGIIHDQRPLLPGMKIRLIGVVQLRRKSRRPVPIRES
ncbi:hypothetical protein GCM10027048_28480 [Hymenobacter coalescens]